MYNMQRNPCPVCGGTGKLVEGGSCTRPFCEEGAFPITSANKINVVFPQAGGIILDVSLRTEDPSSILQDLRRELALMNQGETPYVPEDRYAEVTVRAAHGFLSLLRLMRWDTLFSFQEITGLPWPKQFIYHWRRAMPRKRSAWSNPPDDNYSTMSAMEVSICWLQTWGKDINEETLRPLEKEVARILGRK